MPDSTAPSFFVSYSHHDADWRAALFDRCIATTSGDCLVWSDAQLRAGDAWCPQIEAQLAACSVAVLLVSPNFLASTFIAERTSRTIFTTMVPASGGICSITACSGVTSQKGGMNCWSRRCH